MGGGLPASLVMRLCKVSERQEVRSIPDGGNIRLVFRDFTTSSGNILHNPFLLLVIRYNGTESILLKLLLHKCNKYGIK